MATTYITTAELSSLIKYDSRTIRERLVNSVLLEGVHYIRPFGGRKILYIWERIEVDMALSSITSTFSGVSEDVGTTNRNLPAGFAIPMANGSACRVAKISCKTSKAKINSDVSAIKEVRHGKY